MKAKDFIKIHPRCCFCGGTTAATTITHLPARIIFPRRHRPKRLEFPACATCNAQTRGDDSILAIVARALGSMRSRIPLIDEATLANAVGTAQISFPGFKLADRQDLQHVNDGLRKVRAFDVDHPIVHLCLCRLAAKFSLATFYQLTQGIADQTYRINTMWTHSQHQEADELASILKIFPKTFSLKQGKWDTADTFFLRHVKDGRTLITAAVFYDSILLCGRIAPPFEANAWAPTQMTWCPSEGQGVIRRTLAP